jgi:AsmA protein
MDATTEDGGGERFGKLARWALVAVLGAGVLYVGAAVLLHTLLDSESLRQRIETRMESNLARDVELGGVDLSVFPGLGVELRDLSVSSPEGMEAPPVASAEEVRLGIALLPLLRRRVRMDRASAEGVEVRLVVAEDGRSNFGDFVPEGDAAPDAGEAGESSFSLEVRDVRLDRGRIEYRDRATGREVVARDLSADATVQRDADVWRIDGRIAAGELRGRGYPAADRWSGRPVEATFDGRAGPEARWLEIGSGSARVGPVEVTVDGRVDSLRSPERLLDLRVRAGELALQDVASLALAGDAGGDRLSGVLGVDLEVSGRLGPEVRPTATGTVTLRDGAYRDEDGGRLAEGLEGEAALRPDSVLLRRLTGRLMDGPLEVRGSLDLAADERPFAGRVRAAPRLERRPGGDTDSLEASGTVGVEADVAGRLGVPSATRVRGTATPEDVRVRRADWAGDVGLPSGTVRLDGDRASADDLPVVVDGDTLRLTGRLLGLFSRLGDEGARPELDAGLRGPRLDLGVLFPPEAEGPSYGQLAFAHLGGRRLQGRTAVEVATARGTTRPAVPPVLGELRVEVDELVYVPWRLSGASGRVVFGEDRVEVREAGFDVLGGRASGSVALGLGPEPLQPFSLRLDVEGAEGSDLLARLTPLGALLSGTTSLRMVAAGTLDTLLLPASSGLEGEGRLEVARGRMRENPVTRAAARRLSLPALREPGFDRFVAPFRIRGDSLQLPSSSFTADSLSVRFDGGMGLDGRLDLAVGLDLPRRLLSKIQLPDGGAGDALRRLVEGDGRAGTLTLAIRGTTDDPRVEIGAASPSGDVPAGVRKEVENQLQDRARDLFDRVTGGRDAPDDTAAADSAPPDSSGGG